MRTDDRVQHIAQIFNEVNRTYFDGVIPVPTFRLSTRLTHTAGWVTYDDWTMAISAPYHDHYDWEDELVDTIKHEAIHLYLAYSFRPSGHTKEFKALSQQIGATHYGKAMPRRRPHYRYYKTCSHCGGQSVSGSWRPDAACGACCEAYNGGRYTPQFKLTLLKRERLPLPVPAEGSSAAELEQPAAPPRRAITAVHGGLALRPVGVCSKHHFAHACPRGPCRREMTRFRVHLYVQQLSVLQTMFVHHEERKG